VGPGTPDRHGLYLGKMQAGVLPCAYGQGKIHASARTDLITPALVTWAPAAPLPGPRGARSQCCRADRRPPPPPPRGHPLLIQVCPDVADAAARSGAEKQQHPEQRGAAVRGRAGPKREDREYSKWAELPEPLLGIIFRHLEEGPAAADQKPRVGGGRGGGGGGGDSRLPT
jgi:hypothetical protein